VDAELSQSIAQGCAALGLALPPDVIDRLVVYVQMLVKWNRVYNLTAVREPVAMVRLHILDSLAVLPFLTAGRLLDAGTGAGLPGLPLALARPDCQVTLLDSSAKKLRFVRQAAAELGIGNVEVLHARMQEYRPAQAFDMVISRAVASVGDLYQQTRHLVRPGGRFLFMKGAFPAAELAVAGLPRPVRVDELRVPGLEAERHLVWFEQEQDTASVTQ
jgi:16S rRNA (guanine527-N7)-methyltransferase